VNQRARALDRHGIRLLGMLGALMLDTAVQKRAKPSETTQASSALRQHERHAILVVA
jgi:hypothetical protein